MSDNVGTRHKDAYLEQLDTVFKLTSIYNNQCIWISSRGKKKGTETMFSTEPKCIEFKKFIDNQHNVLLNHIGIYEKEDIKEEYRGVLRKGTDSTYKNNMKI